MPTKGREVITGLKKDAASVKEKIIWFPAILLMVGIFYFSSQPAEISGDLSGGISGTFNRVCFAWDDGCSGCEILKQLEPSW